MRRAAARLAPRRVETRLIVAEGFEKLSEILPFEDVTRRHRFDFIVKRIVDNFESCHLLHPRRDAPPIRY